MDWLAPTSREYLFIDAKNSRWWAYTSSSVLVLVMCQNCNIDAGHNTDYFLGTSGKAERREEDQADNPADRQATVTNHFISSKSALLAMLTELHRTSCLFSDCDSMPLPEQVPLALGRAPPQTPSLQNEWPMWQPCSQTQPRLSASRVWLPGSPSASSTPLEC